MENHNIAIDELKMDGISRRLARVLAPLVAAIPPLALAFSASCTYWAAYTPS